MPRGIILLIFSLFCLFENVAKISAVGSKKEEEVCGLQPHTLYSSNYIPFSRAPCPPASHSSPRELWDGV